jgi:hypothetical protein
MSREEKRKSNEWHFFLVKFQEEKAQARVKIRENQLGSESAETEKVNSG